VRGAPIVVLTLLVALGAPRRGAAQGRDYATSGDGWNSVSQLIRIAREHRVPVEIPDRLDVGTLDPSDSILILAPSEELPGSALTEFLQAGGRACLADDFGAGESLLGLFSIDRAAPSEAISMQLRGNPALLVARPRGNHRLTRDVAALVTNHPSVVVHRELAPIYEVGSGEAVVLAGAVGSGRLVVLSDPSVLIDNMMRLRGNRRFAENLVAYLTEGRAGRLIVVRPEVPVVGRYGEPGADRSLHDLRSSLEQLASLDVPPLALRIGSLALAAIAFILALGALPRRSPYRTARMFAREAAQGGFVGRVGFFSRPGTNLLQPLMVYKFELEAEILRHLERGGKTLLRDVLSAMRERGMSEDDVDDMRTLLLTLDQLHAAQDRPATPPTVTPKRFRELVDRGERLLERIAS